jgi:DNA-binding transcriptional regulator GbsR (MarR family)
MAKTSLSPEREFIERLGLLIEAEGLPRIAGRIMGFLVVNGGPCHAADLAEQLEISHGSVSTNTRLLEQLGVLERTSFPGDRAAYYQLSPDPYASLLGGSLARLQKMRTFLADSRRDLADSPPDARRRLIAMERFYHLAAKQTEEFLARWQSEQAAGRRTE